MHGLDLFTLNCVTVANMFLSTAAMYLVARLNGRADRIRYCAAAGLVISCGFGMAPMRLFISGRWLNLLSNVLIVWGACLMVRGIRGFRSLHLVRKARFARVILLYGIAYAVLLYGYDSLRARTVLASAALAVLMAACAWAMGVKVARRDRLVYWTTAGFYALSAVSAAARALWFLRAVPRASMFAADPVEYFNIIAVNLSAMGGAFGLCLATNLRLIQESETLALYDSLTKLPNRRLFEQRLAEAEERALASGHPLAVIYCDLDDFKRINDSMGHEAGDRYLIAVANRLRRLVDENACLARIGGDEFIVLIERAEKRRELLDLIGRIEAAVPEPVHIGGRIASAGISCGLAIYPEDAGNASDLLRQADAAMYAIKQHGRLVPL